MTSIESRWRRLDGWPIAIFLLTTINVIVFFDHYRGRLEFPWDFQMSYYAFVAYWTTAVSHGVSPEWVPFEQMGYPLMMNLQTGIGYPPLWFFPATGITYTMHAAVVFQLLHVLWGALGAYALGRALFGKGLTPLFIGIAYHFFGGFYSNAEHIDIIRAFAWLPWLLLGVYLRPGQRALEPRNLALPAIVALAITSSYPGNIASHLFVTGCVLVAPFLLKNRPAPRLLVAGLILMIVGIVLSAPVLYPAWAFKAQLTRSVGTHPIQMPWPVANWPYLFLPFRPGWPYQHDISMVSALVPLAVVVFVGMLRKESLKQALPWLVMLFISLAMLPGEVSWVASGLRKLVPFMGLSRFPSSDYRAPMALALMLLAGAGLHDALEMGAPARRLFLRRSWIPVAIVAAVLVTIHGTAIPAAVSVGLGLSLAATLAVSFILFSGTPLARTVGGVGLVVVVVVAGFLTVGASEITWKTPPASERYQAAIGVSTDQRPPIEPMLTRPLTIRPARHDTPELMDYSWRGYLDGSFQTRDLTGTQFMGQSRVINEPPLLPWMLQGWETRILAAGTATEPTACDQLKARITDAKPDSSMTSLQYGVNDVRYQVHLEQPALVVENEMHFPGWSGTLEEPGRAPTPVTPLAVCGGLRAWDLPAGDYQLSAHFEMPYLRLALTFSGLLLAAYLAWATWAARALARRLVN